MIGTHQATAEQHLENFANTLKKLDPAPPEASIALISQLPDFTPNIGNQSLKEALTMILDFMKKHGTTAPLTVSQLESLEALYQSKSRNLITPAQEIVALFDEIDRFDVSVLHELGRVRGLNPYSIAAKRLEADFNLTNEGSVLLDEESLSFSIKETFQARMATSILEPEFAYGYLAEKLLGFLRSTNHWDDANGCARGLSRFAITPDGEVHLYAAKSE